MPAKPRGIDGMVKVSNGHVPPEFTQNPLPAEKATLERAICGGAVRGQEFHKLNPWRISQPPRQLEENNFDFALDTSDGVEYLDLVEFAPLQARRGGYEGLPKVQQVGRVADEFVRLIAQKSARYGRPRRASVHLLVFSTDFRLHLNDRTMLLLKILLRRDNHEFRSISHYVPIDEVTGLYTLLNPAPGGVPHLTPEQERTLRLTTWANLDPRDFKMTDDGQGAFIELPKG